MVVLGRSYVKLDVGPFSPLAPIVGWKAPHFIVSSALGGFRALTASQTARTLVFDECDFFDRPELFYDDFTFLHPAFCPGWVSGLRSFLAKYDASIPASWVRRAAHWSDSPSRRHAAIPSVAQSRLAESAFLRQQFFKLAGASRADSTVSNLGNAGLKLLWWLASRGHSLPPSQWALTEYLVFCSSFNGTSGSVSTARGALLHLCRINAWDKSPYEKGISLVPGQALARVNRHQTKKSEGLSLPMVKRFLKIYCFVRLRRLPSYQWELAIGVSFVVAFKVFARWNDLMQLRWDHGYFEISELYVRFFLEHRKNAQYNGNFVDVARPENGERGAYHVIVEAYEVFRKGHVLPFIHASGLVDSSRYMPYALYVRHLRQALRHIGISAAHAERFAGQSARAGAATTAARAGLQPSELCRLAGVTSISWCLAYMRPDFNDRMRASWAIGL